MAKTTYIEKQWQWRANRNGKISLRCIMTWNGSSNGSSNGSRIDLQCVTTSGGGNGGRVAFTVAQVVVRETMDDSTVPLVADGGPAEAAGEN
ncbi:hypothetical protein IV203_035207 [Nitzschia inconspicua]|uniref:Uncharacterized protein n=1 Tax=Nitzschia inconspicua TaxID=303405 RepID=A0A9K3LEJ7_9STRA|nr:hypothetical protein IV203_035207 [Nitzschia inconspicua]